MGPDGKRLDKPKYGGRKVFFRRLWCRIQGIPIDEASEGPARKRPRKLQIQDDQIWMGMFQKLVEHKK